MSLYYTGVNSCSVLPHSSSMSPENAIGLLGTIASKPYEACEEEWKKTLRLLRLEVCFIPAIQTILQQGRWRGQPNPAAYVRKGAMRCAIREGMIDLPVRPSSHEVLASDLNYRDADGDLLPHDERLDAAKFGSFDGYDDYWTPLDRVSRDLVDDHTESVDWDRAAELAGLDAGERAVLDLRLLLEIGRDQALSICHTDDDRRLLQAAWKRFNRHQDALKKVLLSGQPHKSRRISADRPEDALELVFVPMPNGGLKISFVKVVPESGI